jgi:tetratricopeptide (TPR) repeat protein
MTIRRFAYAVILSALVLDARLTLRAAETPEPPAQVPAKPPVVEKASPTETDAPSADEVPPAAPASPPSGASDTEPPADKPVDESPVDAQNPGQADLDKAIATKLDAESPAEISEVIKLAQQSLDKGLDKENEPFAKKLLASALFQRGRMLCEPIFGMPRPDARWPQLRQLAVADLERALKLEPEQPAEQLLLGRLYALPGGDKRLALTAIEQAIRFSDEEPNLQAEALMLHVGLDDNPDDRLADLGKLIKIRPQDPAPFRVRGSLNLGLGKAQEALQDFDASLKLDPKHASTYEVRGLALAMLKRLDEARESYSKAVELAPKSPALLLERAQINFMSEKFEAAVEDATLALKIDPENGAALLLRSQALSRLGKSEAALADVDEVLKARPNLSPALRTRAVIEASAGKTEEAIEDLQRIADQAPDDVEVRFQLAVLYRSQKKFTKAFTVLEAALSLAPDNWLLHYTRADMNLSIGKHADALKDYELAFAGQSKDSGLLNNFAWLLATSPDDKVRDGQRAVKLATQAAELTQFKQAHILSTLAACYAETGDFEKAKEWSQKSVDVATDDDMKANLRKELASYEGRHPWRELQHEEQTATVKEEPKQQEEAASAPSDKPLR